MIKRKTDGHTEKYTYRWYRKDDKWTYMHLHKEYEIHSQIDRLIGRYLSRNLEEERDT